MKKFAMFVLIFLCVISMVGCNNISEYIIEEDGIQFLILPISKSRVHIAEEYKEHVNDIDIDMLKAAEEKINEQVSQHTENSAIFLSTNDDGYLCLSAEIIVDSPSSDIGHEHKFFHEQITK